MASSRDLPSVKSTSSRRLSDINNKATTTTSYKNSKNTVASIRHSKGLKVSSSTNMVNASETYDVLPKASKVTSKVAMKPRVNFEVKEDSPRRCLELLKKKNGEINAINEKLKIDADTKINLLQDQINLQKENIAALTDEVSDLERKLIDEKKKCEIFANDLIEKTDAKDMEIKHLKSELMMKAEEILKSKKLFETRIMLKEEALLNNQENYHNLEVENASLKDRNSNLLKKMLVIEEELKNVTSSNQMNKSEDLEDLTARFLETVGDICKNKSLKVKAESDEGNVRLSLKMFTRNDEVIRKDDPRITPGFKFTLKAVDGPNFCSDTPFIDAGKFSCLEVNTQKKTKKRTSEGASSVIRRLSISESCKTPNVRTSLLFGDQEPEWSTGTYNRASELDSKMSALWDRLTSQNETLKDLKGEKQRFISCVELLEDQLMKSRIEHKKLVEEVNIVKKLFI